MAHGREPTRTNETRQGEVVRRRNEAASMMRSGPAFQRAKNHERDSHQIHVNADQTRVYFLDLSHWGRAVLKDIDFYEVNGSMVFPIYGARGGLAASYISYFDTAFQLWSDSPRSGAYIDTLARPSGYYTTGS